MQRAEYYYDTQQDAYNEEYSGVPYPRRSSNRVLTSTIPERYRQTNLLLCLNVLFLVVFLSPFR
jgi:hypothetical protein